MKGPLAKPTVHLNGTSRVDLSDGYLDAIYAVKTAIARLGDAAPHDRDYYPQSPEAYRRAVAQHTARLKKLEEVKAELEQIAEAISYERQVP